MRDIVGRVEFNNTQTRILAEHKEMILAEHKEMLAFYRKKVEMLEIDLYHWKSTAEEAEESLKFMQRDRDYWREKAMGGL